ncbi:MAG: hypothetical protein JRI25_12180 [Deltaproteobacteria bacterium]|nr:hypothetical protein [Deltaproteobacteria bacterium]
MRHIAITFEQPPCPWYEPYTVTLSGRGADGRYQREDTTVDRYHWDHSERSGGAILSASPMWTSDKRFLQVSKIGFCDA